MLSISRPVPLKYMKHKKQNQGTTSLCSCATALIYCWPGGSNEQKDTKSTDTSVVNPVMTFTRSAIPALLECWFVSLLLFLHFSLADAVLPHRVESVPSEEEARSAHTIFHISCMRAIAASLMFLFRIIRQDHLNQLQQERLKQTSLAPSSSSFFSSSSSSSSSASSSASSSSVQSADITKLIKQYLSDFLEHIFSHFPISSSSFLQTTSSASSLSKGGDPLSQVANALNVSICRLMAFFLPAADSASSVSLLTAFYLCRFNCRCLCS